MASKARQEHRIIGREILDSLEPEQLSQARRTPLPQRTLRPWESGLFWLLRGYVFIVLALALLEFVRQVQHVAP